MFLAVSWVEQCNSHPHKASFQCLSLFTWCTFMRTPVIRDQGPTLHQDDFIWTSCTCNNPISKSDHLLRHWGVRMSTYGFGERRGHNSTLSNTQGAREGSCLQAVLLAYSCLCLGLWQGPLCRRGGVPLAQLLALGLSCGTNAAAMALAGWAGVAAGAHSFFPCQLYLCHHH